MSTGGGNISIGNIGGNGEVSTAGGNISVGKVSGNAEFNTAGGDINLLLPSDAKVSIEATVYVGKRSNEDDAAKLITSDFSPTTVDFVKNNLVKKFILNGGGSKIELNTASAKIKINKK